MPKCPKSSTGLFVPILIAIVVAGLAAGDLPAQGARSVRAAAGATVIVGTLEDGLAYDVVEIRARAGSQITIEYVNNSGGMPHNIVFVNGESDIQPVGIAALQAAENEYIPQNELHRIFAYTAMAGPGETVSVTILVPEEPGIYPYICTYPGHFTVMQGRLIVR
jgi:azurin